MARTRTWCIPAAACVAIALVAGADSPDADDVGPQPQLVHRLGSAGRAAAPAAVEPVAWCGQAPSATDRKPDLEVSSAQQVHVLYAVPADEPDRFAERASPIATDIGAIDAWWRSQDPARSPRWDLFPSPGCATRAGMLDIAAVRLPRVAAAYAASGETERLTEDLIAITGQLEKTLVYYDAVRSEPEICGESWIAPRYGGRSGFMFLWLRSTCTTDLGSGGEAAVAATHELVHSLGGVQLEGPPNRCRDASRTGHVCDDPADLMFPYATGRALATVTLDAGRNDYYGHAGDWWDVRDSEWLIHLRQHTLTVNVRMAGGTGHVTGDLAALDCPSACELLLDDGLHVNVRAEAAPGSRLWSWGGACWGWGSCEVELGRDTRVTALFGRNRYRLTAKALGRGRITGSAVDLACGRRCGVWVTPGTRVLLAAQPAVGWRFERWTGACAGKRLCRVRLDRDRTVGAVFARS